MNDVLKTIETRRSTRGFSSEQITKNDMEEIVKAGFLAPSAMNAQDWHFVVVQNKEILDTLNLKAKSVLTPELHQRMKDRFNGDENYSLYYNAPTAVFVFEKEDGHYATANCAYASQNMVLMAQSLGYNSCYVGMATRAFTDDECYKMLEVPTGYKISMAIAMGKGSVSMPVVDRDVTKVKYFL